MRLMAGLLLSLLALLPTSERSFAAADTPSAWRLERLSESLWCLHEACNVYIVKRGERALIIDSGEGAVLGCLDSLGIKSVDWVLQTHSHRDQCGATAALAARGAKVAVPEAEAKYFRDIQSYWDSFGLYIRYQFQPDTYQPRQNVPVDLVLADRDSLLWQGLTFRCLSTPGHTVGSGTWLARIDGRLMAFSGDMIYAPGKLWNLYSFDHRYWDGGFEGVTKDLAGLDKVLASGAQSLLPSHGLRMDGPAGAVAALRENLSRLYDLDPAPEPEKRAGRTHSEPPRRWTRVSEHLYHVRPTSFLLVAPDSSAMFYDYYAIPEIKEPEYYDSILPVLAELGVKRIDLVIPSHFHEDHIRGIPDLQHRYGAKVWVYENMADLLENPSRYNLCCVAPERIVADRVLHDSEIITWKGYEFTIVHFPGQTMYHQGMYGVVDGSRVFFTGDTDVYGPKDYNLIHRSRKLHGISTFLNYYLLEPGQGYLKALQRLIDFNPELLLCAHSGAKPGNAEMYRLNMESMLPRRELVAAVLPQPDPNEGFDPNRVRFYPYSLTIAPGEAFETRVILRNHRAGAVQACLSLAVPAGWTVEPKDAALRVAGKDEAGVRFTVTPGARPAGHRRTVITAQVTQDCEDLGEPAEMLLEWK